MIPLRHLPRRQPGELRGDKLLPAGNDSRHFFSVDDKGFLLAK